MSKETQPGYEFEIDPEAGKYEQFPVICKECNVEYTYNSPASMFKNSDELDKYQKKVQADFRCELCKNRVDTKKIAQELKERDDAIKAQNKK